MEVQRFNEDGPGVEIVYGGSKSYTVGTRLQPASAQYPGDIWILRRVNRNGGSDVCEIFAGSEIQLQRGQSEVKQVGMAVDELWDDKPGFEVDLASTVSNRRLHYLVALMTDMADDCPVN